MSVAATTSESGPRRLPTPITEPPFDDPAGMGPPSVPATQGALALEFVLPSGVPAVPRPTLRLVPEQSAARPGRPLPDVTDWAHTIAIAVGEILTGARSAVPFSQWATPEVVAKLGRRAAIAGRLRGPRRRTTVRAVHVCMPTEGIAEISTVVHGLSRPRALAFRLEARRERWVCTELELG